MSFSFALLSIYGVDSTRDLNAVATCELPPEDRVGLNINRPVTEVRGRF